MPFNLGSAVYSFHVQGLNQATRTLNSFHGQLQILARGNFLAGLSRSFSQFNAILQTTIGRLGITSGIMALVGSTGILGGVSAAIRLSAEFEQQRVTMGMMLGDMQKATKLLAEMSDFAAETPLNLPGIERASLSLINAKVATQDIIPTLRMIGDVGFTLRGEQGFQHLAHLYQQFKVQQRLTMQDMYQLTNLNIPIWEELGKVMGVSETRVRRMVSEGRIGFNQIHNALVNMTREGGRFHGMMEASSKTLLGRWSTFVDLIRIRVLRVLGDKIVQRFQLGERLEQAIRIAEKFGTVFGKNIDSILDGVAKLGGEVWTFVKDVGTVLLPIAQRIWDIVRVIARWAAEHKELTKWILGTYIGLRMLGGTIPGLVSAVGSLATSFGKLAYNLILSRGAMLGMSGAAASAATLGFAVGGAGLGYLGYKMYQSTPNPQAIASQALRERTPAKEFFIPGRDYKPPGQSGKGGTYPRMLPNTPPLGGGGQTSKQTGWVGISDLATRMQERSLEQAQLTSISDAATKTAEHMATLAGLVDGGAMRVTYPADSMPIPTWGRG